MEACLYYKLTHESKGSGEKKISMYAETFEALRSKLKYAQMRRNRRFRQNKKGHTMSHEFEITSDLSILTAGVAYP